MKKIKVDILNLSSLDNMCEELKAYKDSLVEKVNELVDALVLEGMNVARVRLASTVGDSTEATLDSDPPTVKVNGSKAVIYLSGKDAIFIEFGAGIAYNTGRQHPLADEFGFGPGTYPSKHPPNRAINPGKWVYKKDGEKVWSIGTGASMPLYGATEHIRNVLVQKVNEVFGS